MNRIFKYNLSHGIHEPKFQLELPMGAEILSASFDVKDDEPCLWALVDPSNPTRMRTFDLVDTGKNIYILDEETNQPYHRKFIATFQFHHGYTIKHLFERVYF